MSTFTVAGVSTQYGITKVRFANDLASRVKLLSKGGHSPLELMELPKAMTKAEACQHLIDVGGVFKQWSALLNETMGKKQGTVASKPAKAAPAKTPAKSVPAKKAVPAKPAKAPKTPKAIEDDLELEELKQLAAA
jgi:hypothetical protein